MKLLILISWYCNSQKRSLFLLSKRKPLDPEVNRLGYGLIIDTRILYSRREI